MRSVSWRHCIAGFLICSEEHALPPSQSLTLRRGRCAAAARPAERELPRPDVRRHADLHVARDLPGRVVRWPRDLRLPAAAPARHQAHHRSRAWCGLSVTPFAGDRVPYRASSHRYGERSDIWGLGCVLYEALCLEHPFGDCTTIDQLRQKARAAPLESFYALRPPSPPRVPAGDAETRFLTLPKALLLLRLLILPSPALGGASLQVCYGAIRPIPPGGPYSAAVRGLAMSMLSGPPGMRCAGADPPLGLPFLLQAFEPQADPPHSALFSMFHRRSNRYSPRFCQLAGRCNLVKQSPCR